MLIGSNNHLQANHINKGARRREAHFWPNSGGATCLTLLVETRLLAYVSPPSVVFLSGPAAVRAGRDLLSGRVLRLRPGGSRASARSGASRRSRRETLTLDARCSSPGSGRSRLKRALQSPPSETDPIRTEAMRFRTQLRWLQDVVDACASPFSDPPVEDHDFCQEEQQSGELIGANTLV